MQIYFEVCHTYTIFAQKDEKCAVFASGDDFYTSSDVCLSYLGLLFRVGCLLQGRQVRAATDCLRT